MLGLIGAGLGLAGSLFGPDQTTQDTQSSSNYGSNTQSQQNMTNYGQGGYTGQTQNTLRGFDPGEQAMYGNVTQQLGNLTAPGAQNRYFEGMWNPMKQNMQNMFTKQSGQMRADMAKTGGGPGSISRAQQGNLGAQQALQMSTARGQTQGLASQLQNADIANLMNMYGGMWGAQNIGGGTTSSGDQWSRGGATQTGSSNTTGQSSTTGSSTQQAPSGLMQGLGGLAGQGIAHHYGWGK